MTFAEFLNHPKIYNPQLQRQIEAFERSPYREKVPNWKQLCTLSVEMLDTSLVDGCQGFSWVSREANQQSQHIVSALKHFGASSFQLSRTDKNCFTGHTDMQLQLSVLGTKVYFDCYDRVLGEEITSCGLLCFNSQGELVSVDTVYDAHKQHFSVLPIQDEYCD